MMPPIRTASAPRDERLVMENARELYRPCIRCGSIGSTCGRHYNGFRQLSYGKGRSIKCHLLLVADLCAECDADFQEGSVSKGDLQARIEYSEEFQHWCILSAIRRFGEGIMVVK